jgi:hypothetical protein
MCSLSASGLQKMGNTTALQQLDQEAAALDQRIQNVKDVIAINEDPVDHGIYWAEVSRSKGQHSLRTYLNATVMALRHMLLAGISSTSGIMLDLHS